MKAFRDSVRRVMQVCVAAFASFQLAAPAVAQTAGETLIQQIQARGELRVGVDQGKPFVFKEAASDEWTGIYMDVVARWAETLNVKLVSVPTTWANMVAGLQANQFDIAVALNPTPARSLSVVFSDPLIYEIGAFAVMRSSSFTDWDGLNKEGSKICVPLGSAPDLALTAAAPKAEIVRLRGETDCQVAVTSGRADAFYWAVGNLSAFAAQNENIGLIFPDNAFERQGTAFAFQAGIDMQSLMAFNIQLDSFVNSGALAESRQRWGFVGPQAYAIGPIPPYVAAAGY